MGCLRRHRDRGNRRDGFVVIVLLVESFNGKFRDECLNMYWFLSLADARRQIEIWRVDFNTVRPHSSLGYESPSPTSGGAGLRPTASTTAPLPPPRPVPAGEKRRTAGLPYDER